MVVFGGLAVPFAEELFFRGVVYTALRRYGSVLATLGSAALFGIAHGVSVLLLVAFLFGVVNAVLMERSGSISPRCSRTPRTTRSRSSWPSAGLSPHQRRSAHRLDHAGSEERLVPGAPCAVIGQHLAQERVGVGERPHQPLGRGHREHVLQRDVQGGAGPLAVLGQRAGELRARGDVGRQVGGQDGEHARARRRGRRSGAGPPPPARRTGASRQVPRVAHGGPGRLGTPGAEVEHRAGHRG